MENIYKGSKVLIALPSLTDRGNDTFEAVIINIKVNVSFIFFGEKIVSPLRTVFYERVDNGLASKCTENYIVKLLPQEPRSATIINITGHQRAYE